MSFEDTKEEENDLGTGQTRPCLSFENTGTCKFEEKCNFPHLEGAGRSTKAELIKLLDPHTEHTMEPWLKSSLGIPLADYNKFVMIFSYPHLDMFDVLRINVYGAILDSNVLRGLEVLYNPTDVDDDDDEVSLLCKLVLLISPQPHVHLLHL